MRVSCSPKSASTAWLALMLASRVRKARKPGVCALCRAPVLVGQQIGKTTIRGWCHTSCIIQVGDRPPFAYQPSELGPIPVHYQDRP